MPILGIPDIVVVEAIHVHAETIGVHVHVSDKDSCSMPSISPPAKP